LDITNGLLYIIYWIYYKFEYVNLSDSKKFESNWSEQVKNGYELKIKDYIFIYYLSQLF
jgi:hypothetical protein